MSGIFITPITFSVLRSMIQEIKDPSWSIDGDGANIYNFTVPALGVNVRVLEKNPSRKSITLINLDPTNTVYLVKKINNVDQLLPVLAQGAISFSPIKIGSVRQCQSGYELDQDLITCELPGEIRMNNPNAAPVVITIFEASF